MGIPSQLFFNLVEQFFTPPHLLFVTIRQLPCDVCEREMHGHQKLPGLVVHGIRDPLDLFLQRFIEMPQRRDRILHSAVRHFVRGEHLCQEISSRLQQFLVPRRSLCLAKHPVDGLMMHEGDFHEALFLGDGAAPQLVGPAQRGLAAAPCGDSSEERPSAKSPRIPSVTNTSVSPFATGSTAACSAGNCEPCRPPRSSSTSCALPLCAPARINAPCTLPTPAQVIMPCF